MEKQQAGATAPSSKVNVMTKRRKTEPKQQGEADALSQERVKSSLYVRIVSGSVGSIVTSLVVTPLDVVKVAIQSASSSSSLNAPPPPLLTPAQAGISPCPKGCGTFVLNNGQMESVLPKSLVPWYCKHTGRLTEKARSTFLSGNVQEVGTVTMLRRIYAAEGLNGLYAGLSPTLVMAVPNTVMYFSAYEEIKYRLQKASSNPSASWIPALSGASARLLASTATAPFEFLRTRQASLVGTNQQSGTMWAEFRMLVRNDGFASLFRGLGPTLLRDVPFSAVYWISIERLREVWRQRYNVVVPPTPLEQAFQAFFNGAVSGMIAATCTTPFDVVKTRQQQVVEAATREATTAGADLALCTHGGAAPYHQAQAAPKPAGTFAYLQHIAQTEGVRGLWRGNQTRMLKIAPACAIMISSYELGLRLLE